MKSLPIIKEVLKEASDIPKYQRNEILKVLSGQTRQEPRQETKQSPLLSQKEAATFLNVSRYTILRMVQEYQLHPVEIRGLKRYKRKELETIAGL